MLNHRSNRVTLTHGERFYLCLCYAVMTVFALSIVITLLYILQVTFSGDADTSFRLLPNKFTLNNYKTVLGRGYITRPFLNSVYVTGLRTLVSVTLTTMICYPLSRKDLVGRRFWNFLIIFPSFVDMGFIPSYLLIKQMGIMNSYAALILPVAVTFFNVIIMRNYFEAIPDSIIESARIDGCSEFRILLKIVVPLSTASIATIALFYMVASWNTYFTVILYINDSVKYTLQVVLREMIITGSNLSDASKVLDADVTTTNLEYAVVIIAILPVLIVYPLLQRYFMKGLTLGAVKE